MKVPTLNGGFFSGIHSHRRPPLVTREEGVRELARPPGLSFRQPPALPPPALARFSPITLSTVMKRWLPVLQSSSAVECGKGGKLAAQRFNLRRPVETE